VISENIFDIMILMKLMADWIIRAFVLLVTTYVVPGFKIDSFTTALVVALVLAVLNVLVKPILVLFTLPATILTLGLFLFVINAILIIIVSGFVKGFHVNSFTTAIFASVVITVVSTLVNLIMK